MVISDYCRRESVFLDVVVGHRTVEIVVSHLLPNLSVQLCNY